MNKQSKSKKLAVALSVLAVLSFNALSPFAASTVIDDASGIEPIYWGTPGAPGTPGYTTNWCATSPNFTSNDYSIVWGRSITYGQTKKFTRTQTLNLTGKTVLKAYVALDRFGGTLPSAVKAYLTVKTASATRSGTSLNVVDITNWNTPGTLLSVNLSGLSGLNAVQSITVNYVFPSGTNASFDLFADYIYAE